jgi:hypothetical protein
VLGFEIWKNGKKVATAGLTGSGAMSLMLTWVGKEADAAAQLVAGVEIEGLDLRVGGLDASDPNGEMSVEWIEDTALKLDDDLRIRIVSAENLDAPVRREPTRGVPGVMSGLRFVTCGSCGAPKLEAANPPAE